MNYEALNERLTEEIKELLSLIRGAGSLEPKPGMSDDLEAKFEDVKRLDAIVCGLDKGDISLWEALLRLHQVDMGVRASSPLTLEAWEGSALDLLVALSYHNMPDLHKSVTESAIKIEHISS